MFRGPIINKKNGNLSAITNTADNVCGLIAGGVVTTNYPTLGVAKKLIQATDADALGLNMAYDLTNTVQVRYHIDEFFRINPKGVLWIMLVAKGTSMTNMCDKANQYVKKLINDSGKTIKNVGVVLNPLSNYTPTLTTGIDADVLTAVPKAQQLVDEFQTQNVFIETILIEGREANGAISSMKDFRTMASENVQVTILQDGDQAALKTEYAKTAAVGAVLGSIGVRLCWEDLGALQVVNSPDQTNPDYPIDSLADGRFQKICISSGVEVNTLTAPEIKYLMDSGYIFADQYPEYPGIFLSGSPTCTDINSDFSYSTNVRVWCKAARIAVQKLTPKFNSTVKRDAAGKIKNTTIVSWQESVNNTRDGIGRMVIDEMCDASACFIDPNQDVRVNGLTVAITVQPFDYAREITGNISLGQI